MQRIVLTALVLLLVRGAPCFAQIGTPPPGHAVVVSKATMQDAGWMRVVDAIAKRHGSKVVPFEGAVGMARAGLTPPPGRCAFVLRPEEATRETLVDIHVLTRSLDEDMFMDTCWGVVTGKSSDAALASLASDGSDENPAGDRFDVELWVRSNSLDEKEQLRALKRLAFRGDPARFRTPKASWTTDLSRSGNEWTLKVRAEEKCSPGGHVFHWLPVRVGVAKILEEPGGVVITDDFVMLPLVLDLEAGQEVVVRFTADPRPVDLPEITSIRIMVPERVVPLEVALDRVAPVEPAGKETKARVAAQLARCGKNRTELLECFARCPEDQLEGLTRLVLAMPESDLRTLGHAFLLDNVSHAYEAWRAAPWSKRYPKELFFDHVLPYANVNERRDPWRGDFRRRFKGVVGKDSTPSGVMARLNVDVFKTFGVSYHPTRRPKPDQSPDESIKAGYASCTGLSIMLIDACRAVGVPARFVGTPRWTTVRGNHSWVEVFDEEWLVIGACEPGEPNRTWFMGRAAQADPDVAVNRIYAVDWFGGDRAFPLVWNRRWKEVRAIDVTRFYTQRRRARVRVAGDEGAAKSVTLRLGGRIVAHVDCADEPAVVTLAGNTEYEAEVALRAGEATRVRRARVTTTDAAEQDLVIKVN